MPRYVVLADGKLGVFDAKTATSLIRYRPESVVAVIDREHAGQDIRPLLGVAAQVPIVPDLPSAVPYGPDTLVIGISPSGGRLPPEWRPLLTEALERGLNLVSTLHVFLGDDPELSALAAARGLTITDLRRPPEEQPIAHMEAKSTRAVRVLTVGTDCNVGKMVSALELTAAARARGLDARFLATGQTGVLIWGSGVTLDRIPGDFMAGHVEKLVRDQGDADLLFVEGQGCLLHPAYSGVTAALLHGALPDAMVLVHHPLRTRMRSQPFDLPPLADWVRRYEDFVEPLHPGRVTGIAINGFGLSDAERDAALKQAEVETGLPAADVVAGGAERLLEPITSLLRG